MMAHLKWYWDHQLKKNARVGAVWPPFWMRMEEVLTVYLEDGLYIQHAQIKIFSEGSNSDNFFKVDEEREREEPNTIKSGS